MSNICREWIGTSFKVDGPIAPDDREILVRAVERYDYLLPQHQAITLPAFADLIEAAGIQNDEITQALRRYP